jgi:hypothetical protein
MKRVFYLRKHIGTYKIFKELEPSDSAVPSTENWSRKA